MRAPAQLITGYSAQLIDHSANDHSAQLITTWPKQAGNQDRMSTSMSTSTSTSTARAGVCVYNYLHVSLAVGRDESAESSVGSGQCAEPAGRTVLSKPHPAYSSFFLKSSSSLLHNQHVHSQKNER